MAAVILAAAGPALARSGTAPAQPPAASPPPATPPPGTTPPGPGAATPPANPPAVPEPIPPVETLPVVNQPAPQAPAALQTIDLPANAEYPEGFQDPSGFTNNALADNDREAGFPWGLLGLLGLLGLIPLVRGYGHRRIEREREARRDRD
jgi:hypothetical protein